MGERADLAQELDFRNLTLADDGSFDIVISQGVLHHTSDPYRGFKGLVRSCRPGGFVNIFLYNKWNHWRHNLQKERANRIAEGIVRLSRKLPALYVPSPPFRTPSVLHRFFWQLAYAIQGSRGRYSGGAALCGRKAEAGR